MTPISQPPAQTATTSVRQTRPLPLICLGASVLLYVGILIFGTLVGSQHLYWILLFLQYAVILPVVVWSLRSFPQSGRNSNATCGLPRISYGMVLVAFALVAMPLSWLAAEGRVNPDESGYSFQARLYRSGRVMADPLIGATAEVRQTPDELFYANHILVPKGWFPKFPPGWPLVLSLGYLISAPWLPNPVFGLVQLIAIAAIGRRVFSWETGAMAVFFAIFSPFYLVSSIGMMSHALCALLAAGACLALFQGLASGSSWYYAGMFACVAAALQVRPYTGFALASVTTAAALWLNRKNGAALGRVFGIGVVFGAIALAGVLFYNHTYSGHWLVSPYAMAAGTNTPPELSFNPGRIWQGIREYGRNTVEESLIGAFPFVYLLAGYALVREKRRRTEVWILACLYLALVLAYLGHPDGSGVFFGERFHFEGFFAVLLLAARGLDLLVERWHTPRWALIWAIVLFTVMQTAMQTTTAMTVWRRGEPYRKIRAAVTASNISGLVLLHDSPGFVAKHFNLNEADWRHAPRIYLVDAEPDRRGEWACRYGVAEWTAASYDAQSHRAVLVNGKADCGGGLNPK
jgi:hypothetical protein